MVLLLLHVCAAVLAHSAGFLLGQVHCAGVEADLGVVGRAALDDQVLRSAVTLLHLGVSHVPRCLVPRAE